MAKIYDKYLELKEENPNKLYLFKSGKFYIFVGDDCDYINNYVVLKKVKFSNDSFKCGFPENVLDNYLKVFKNHGLDVELIENHELKNKESIYSYLKNININKTTPLEALVILNDLKNRYKNEE